MSDVLIRLAVPDEFEAIGELREAAYGHDYEISDVYRAALRDVAARSAEQEVWVAFDRYTGQLLGTVTVPRPGGHISALGRWRTGLPAARRGPLLPVGAALGGCLSST